VAQLGKTLLLKLHSVGKVLQREQAINDHYVVIDVKPALDKVGVTIKQKVKLIQ
jgi:hypothetical protein